MKALVKVWTVTASPSTVETRYRIVTAVFRAAVVDRRIASSPCVGVSMPKESKAKVIPAETSVVRALEEALPARARAMVTLAAGTGMRQGEVLGLTVDRIDFLRRTVTVDRQLVSTSGQAPAFGPAKTESSMRTMPLPASSPRRWQPILLHSRSGRTGSCSPTATVSRSGATPFR